MPNETRAHSTPKKRKFCSIGYQSPDNSSREESKKKKPKKKRSNKIKISPKDAPSTPIDWRRKNGAKAYDSPDLHAPTATPGAPKKK
jgi:hypothetical protein